MPDRPEAPKWVGWETDEEWELETRAFNFNEAWSFEEMQRLVNDLWQQYCAAGEIADSLPDAILKAREEAFEEAISAASQKFFPGKVGVQGPSQEAIIQAIRQHSQKGER